MGRDTFRASFSLVQPIEQIEPMETPWPCLFSGVSTHGQRNHRSGFSSGIPNFA
jgi:hypothetical protein